MPKIIGILFFDFDFSKKIPDKTKSIIPVTVYKKAKADIGERPNGRNKLAKYISICGRFLIRKSIKQLNPTIG